MTTPNVWRNGFQVNTGTAATGGQSDSKIVGLANGGFVVIWTEQTDGLIGTSAGTDIIAKIFDAEGNVVRDSYQLNSSWSVDDERDVSITATHDGFAIAYVDDSIGAANATGIRFQRFNLDGNFVQSQSIDDENVLEDFRADPQIAANLLAANDDIFVVFEDDVGTNTDISGRVFDENGLIGVEFAAAQNSIDADRLGEVAVLSNGNFVTVYTEADTVQGIEFKIVTPAGVTVSNVNVSDSFTGGVFANEPAVASLAGGGFVVVWTESGDILARAYSNTGVSLFNEITAAGGINNQNEPVVVGLPDGDFVVAWDDDSGQNLVAQRFNADGTTDGFQFIVENTGTTDIDISVTADGRVLFSWTAGNGSGEIFASIWDPRAYVINPDDYGTASANFLATDVITTSVTGSQVNAGAKGDTVLGQQGGDRIYSSGDGTFRGGGGNDIIFGNEATTVGDFELLDGGAGAFDYLVINSYTGNWGVNMVSGAVTLNGAAFANASYINFEDIATGIGNDSIVGTSGANTIQTSSGNDTINSGLGNDRVFGQDGDDLIFANAGGINTVSGGSGNDTIYSSGAGSYSGDAGDDTIFTGVGTSETLDGGTGIDTLITTGSAVNYNINLVTGVTNFAPESFTNFENINTGVGNDTITGTAGANVINSGSGNDLILSGDGNDTVVAQVGTNSVFAGNDNDTIFTSGFGVYRGEAGDDDFVSGNGTSETLDGGTGIDRLFTTSSGVNYTINLATGATNFASEFFFNFESVFTGSGNDSITGTNGANRIEANVGNDTIDGGLGDDTILGGAGDDVINSANNSSDNRVYGGTGNDVITSSGRGEYYGEDGDDRIIVANGTDETLNGGIGNDTLDASAVTFNYVLNLTTGLTNFAGEFYTEFENVLSGSGSDELRGTLGANLMDGGAGNDRILGFAGNDTLMGGLGVDTLNGGDGDDSLSGGDGDDKVFAEAGNDSIDGGAGNDLLEGKIGDDTIRGDVGNDTLRGSDGEDRIDGGDGDDVAFGGNDNDSIFGGDGNDTLDGSSGDDSIDGWVGDDVIVGETGNDFLQGYDGNDTMRGGGGNDSMYGENDDDLMFGSAGEDQMFGGSGNDTMSGDTQADEMYGDSGNDILRGGDGFDFLDGGDGNDILAGGNGNDTLNGGAGQDTLRGNAQTDTYVFDSEFNSTFFASDLIDNIDGVGVAGGDIIDLSGIDANTLVGGDQAFTFLGFQSTASGLGFGAGGLWLEDVGTQTLLYGNTDNDAVIEFAVRINDGAGITASDYILGDFIV